LGKHKGVLMEATLMTLHRPCPAREVVISGRDFQSRNDFHKKLTECIHRPAKIRSMFWIAVSLGKSIVGGTASSRSDGKVFVAGEHVAVAWS
jgi:hypothetical protein